MPTCDFMAVEIGVCRRQLQSTKCRWAGRAEIPGLFYILSSTGLIALMSLFVGNYSNRECR